LPERTIPPPPPYVLLQKILLFSKEIILS